ncbi:MAG: redoxin domain-containing protein, partial [Myxococcota bacterium]|nr:redoxin domain-containing protein [Myxococcota bacterium]
APDFELATNSGGVFRSRTLRGSWVVLHFTASWCPFCDAEVEHLGALAADYASRGVKVVIIDVKEDEARWTAYAKEHVSPAVIAIRDATGDAARRYAPPRAQPSFEDRSQVVLDATLIIDGAGKIRLFLMPDSKHFDPTFKAVRDELEGMLSAENAEPPTLAPDKIVSVAAGDAAIARPGGTGEVIIALSIAPFYHLMSDRPSAPEYIPTRVRLEDVDGVAFGEATYPAPVPFKLANHAIATFQGAVEVRIPFQVAAGAAPGDRKVKAALRYQACTATRCLFPATHVFETRATIRPGD